MSANVISPVMPGPAQTIRSVLPRLPKPRLQAPLLLVATAPGDHTNRAIKCKPYLNSGSLTARQAADLNIGSIAVEAVWRCIQSTWSGHWPMTNCILVALMVRDTLRGMGRGDAEVMPVGSQHLRFSRGKLVNALTIGCPSAPEIPGQWNAHMIVKIGDILLDPTCGQTQRVWNAAPDTSALLFESKLPEVSLDSFGTTTGLARARYLHAGLKFEMNYFDLTPAVVKRTSGWDKINDALPIRRAGIVHAALQLLAKGVAA